jgi:simple sugar transport system permease protein
MILTGTFSDGMVGGRGWLALQLVIFGRWIPGYILAGSLFFAYIEALQFRFAMTIQAVPAQFFLILPYLFAIIALVLVYRRAESPQSLMKPYDREQR